ncbi:type I-E CRISPR-associated protein Cse1/CasA [Chromohalobacter beijerinckii]|uniref:Type I-E CRISPR-associated protein Cse1/CasA n=1 Tax=Chromohalobacter beijerinckii TaxID=86179 RepID=A0ABV8X9F6_9GAMM|nr:type I-E CRISPR-associated protein Cse1/CasA [Chromohalobacter beijerinckii]MCK0766471.1 type I-E CRISPR-associated protein Cse1/CasA [Chromohalobacter beijerinckii]
MNLLTASWLPFRCRGGRIEYRPPSALADHDVIDLALPRADFQGAAWQFLIALLQTAMTPEDTDAWLDRYQTPPSVTELDELLAPFASAFELDGDGPRFMQDLDPLDDVKEAPVAGLLIDSPGANGIKNNTDFFVKRGRVETVCPKCAALALFTMQINAPAGGAGIRVGLRGGGPLTTLILPEDERKLLWARLWPNVMPADAVGQPGQACRAPRVDDSDLFFWMAETRISDKKGKEVLPEQVHPLHAFWSMPRRYRLLFDDTPGTCDLCGREAARPVRRLRAKKQGANYDGPWRHPLTPYRKLNPKKNDELPLSSKGQPGGLGYRHWPGLVLEDEAVSGALPARVVTHHLHKYRMVAAARDDGEAFEALFKRTRLWVFGYDMDNMKPRGWYSVEMPLVGVPDAYQETLRGWAKRFVDLASEFTWTLRNQLKRAWFKRPEDAKGDMSQIDAQFFEATQLAFFSALREMGEVLRKEMETPELSPETHRQWYLALKREALALFDDQAVSGPLEGMKMQQLERITSARRYLQAYLNGRGKKVGKTVQTFAQVGGFELSTPAPENNPEGTTV